MAHFAELDTRIKVLRVLVVDNGDSGGGDLSSENVGIGFCQSLFGEHTIWKQTSYNANFRGNAAHVGGVYMEGVATLGVGSTDIFIDPQPFDSWTLSTTKAIWIPPTNPGEAPALSADELADDKWYEWNDSNYNADPSTAWVLR